MLMRPSARARGEPGHVWMPNPNARWWRALARSTRNSVGLLEVPRIPVRGAVQHHQRGAGRDLDPADRGGDA